MVGNGSGAGGEFPGTVVVLGATGGIGSELTRSLAAAGATVSLVGRSHDRTNDLANQVGGLALTADATSIDEVDRAVESARERFGRVSGIANCVGSLLLKPAHLTSFEEWQSTMAINLTSAFAAVRAAGRHMRDDGGSVVLVASAAARIGLPNHEAIAAAKAGIIGLTQAAAATYGKQGIRVNCVAPGLVDTPLTERITRSDTALEASRRMHAVGRIGTARDIAASMMWLLDNDNSWITGQVLGVDGGLSRVR